MLPLRKRAAQGVASISLRRALVLFPAKTSQANRNGPVWSHFPFAQIADTRLGLYASRSQSKATRGVPSDTYTTPARLNPALAMVPCMGRLS